MDNLNQIEIDDGNSVIEFIVKSAITLLVLTFLASVLLLALETDFFRNRSSYDLARIGSWGDVVGGVLNPLFSFLALIGLLWTIRLQSKELGLSRKELELTRKELEGNRQASEKMVEAANQQNIENAFFQLLELVNKTAGDVSINYERGPLGSETATALGPEAFEKIENEITKSLRNFWKKSLEGTTAPKHSADWLISNNLISKNVSRNEKILNLTNHCYNKVYIKNRASLGIYYRVLYNMLKFLSEKKTDLPTSMYETYCKIVRAKLSDFELILIFFNCLTEVGAPMKKYVADFQLFDNLPLDELRFTIYYDFDHMNHNNKKTQTLNLLDLSSKFELVSFGRNEDIISEYLAKQSNTVLAP